MNKLDLSVLLVEDDNVSKTLYSNFLKKIVEKVYVADDGIEGIEKFKKHNPDLILSDIRMPRMDGLEMTKKIKQIDDSVKVILVSGHQETDYFIKSIELGVSGYLLKPVKQDKLLKIIGDIGNTILLNKRVKETEKRFRDLAELLPEIVFEADLDGNLTFINKKAYKILGYTEEEITRGLTIHQIILPELDAVENMDLLLNNLSLANFDREVEIRVRTKKGKTFPALMNASSIIESGNSIGIRGVMVNINKLKKIEYELRRNQQTVERILQSSPDPIIVTNLNNEIVISNNAAESLFKRITIENPIGINFISQIIEEQRNKAINDFKKIQKRDYLKNLEYTFLDKKGNEIFTEISVGVIKESSGKPDLMVSIIKDITERKMMIAELQLLNRNLESKVKERTKLLTSEIAERKYAELQLKQRMQFIELINKTSSEFIGLDNVQIGEGINKALKDVASFTRSERGYVYTLNSEKKIYSIANEWYKKGLVARMDILKSIPISVFKTLHNTLKKGERVIIKRAKLQDFFSGKEFLKQLENLECESSIFIPLFIGKSMIGFYGFDSINKKEAWTNDNINAFEITGQIIANAIQRQEYEKALIKAKVKAEESDKSKSAFLANVSHEIQTPIKAIISFSNMIQSPDISKKRKDEFLSIINSNSDALLNLTNDILEFTKIQSNVIKLFKIDFDLNLFLQELFTHFNSLRIKQDRQGIKLKTNIPIENKSCLINSDPLRLKQIFTNLIGNSFKFTDSGHVEYGYEITDADSIKFYVKDSGIGISKKYQKLIFDRFIQEPKPLNIKKEGTGLGLAITHSLVNILGGKIWVESEIKKGSSFYFEIPDLIVQESVTDEQYSWKDKQILIVDDIIQNYIQLEEILKEKVKILYVGDSNQAVEICKSNKNINLILCSNSVLIKDNNQSFVKLKKQNPSLKIIGLSNNENKSKQLGDRIKEIDNTISKPYNAEKILPLLDEYLR